MIPIQISCRHNSSNRAIDILFGMQDGDLRSRQARGRCIRDGGILGVAKCHDIARIKSIGERSLADDLLENIPA